MLLILLLRHVDQRDSRASGQGFGSSARGMPGNRPRRIHSREFPFFGGMTCDIRKPGFAMYPACWREGIPWPRTAYSAP